VEQGTKGCSSAPAKNIANQPLACTCLHTIYDMCKAADKGMVIGDVRVLEKQGGKSGHYIAP
jgi:hypothetical protein